MMLNKFTFTVMCKDISYPVDYDIVAELLSVSIKKTKRFHVLHMEAPTEFLYRYSNDGITEPDYPLNGGSLTVKIIGRDDPYKLNLSRIENGLKEIAKYEAYFHTLLEGFGEMVIDDFIYYCYFIER